MGRHTAVDGAASHPLVAEALAARTAEAAGTHRESPRAAGEKGDLGWPGEPDREGGGLGWPGGEQDRRPGGEQDTADDEPAQPRRGWRRLFGSAPAA
ncbi:hypothetical protein [Blastococcus xanthinilyticus]|uniref:Uncharacterized protein n=1 Tax=Blastococcus xanthinilyticus TaxID=1564164 RepID=A0A5S5D4N5_9ACTN|nr:hypothetical protein [Blastococcus xanthinilyticus]TYP89639.1 hypothetical protein BD833_102112 [Blastococcus xanthinilyticus]